jgi:hypothetical protein
MADTDTPPGTMATVAVHEALIRQLITGQDRMIEQLVLIGTAITKGDARFAALEVAQAACRAQHDSPEMVSLRAVPAAVAVMAEQLATMRLVVYGAVGFSLLGLLGCAGAVMVKVLGSHS